MIIARAPLRISFGGGGTDLASYYSRSGGMVVSAAIDKHIYAIVEPSPYGMQVISPDQGIQPQSGPADAPGSRLPLYVAEHCAPGRDVRIFVAGEVPSGTGLGSSSALTVALIAALGEMAGHQRTALDVAELACHIEIDKLGSPIGKQDQYASALGGINVLTFHQDGTVAVEPLHMRDEVRTALEQRLMLFFTGTRRDAGMLLAQQRRRSENREAQTISSLDAIKDLALQMRTALLDGDLDRFGRLLHTSWEHKRQVTAGISTDFIDRCYSLAREAGALGGKITGAGGGGFLLLYCEEASQGSVARALASLGLTSLPFRFSSPGVQVVLNSSDADRERWSR